MIHEIHFMAISTFSGSVPAIVTCPSSLTLTSQPVSAMIWRMILPPGPIISPIFSLGILMILILGAYWEIWARVAGMTSSIFFRIDFRAVLAFARVSSIILRVSPSILTSIWMAVMPFSVPATLKSISAVKYSIPIISVKSTYLFLADTMPMEIPETGFFMGTPASINAKVEPQVEAIEVEPLEDMTSDTKRMV